jgi:DUF4097 and DUF4098 domain-containing protein YvlB
MSSRCFVASGTLLALALTLALALALAAPGCSAQIGLSPAGTTVLVSGLNASETIPAQRFEVEESPRIVVENRVGSVTVNASDDGVVEVEAVKRASRKEDLAAIVLDVARDKDRVMVRGSTDGLTSGTLEITIKAPRTATLKLETGSGAVTVEGFERGTEAKTGVGPITVKRVAGDLALDTGSGAINVDGAAGAVKAETGVGPVTIRGTKGARTAHTGSGAVRIDGAEGPVSVETQVGRIEVEHARGNLTLHSGSGAVRVVDAEGTVVVETLVGAVDVAGRLAGASRLQSGSGAITVTLPAESRLVVEASTGTGRITNAFGLPVEGTVTSVCKGTIGDGSGGSLRVETLVGGISLKKK